MAEYHHTDRGVAILLCESCNGQFPEDGINENGECPECADPLYYIETVEWHDALQRERMWVDDIEVDDE